MKTDYQPNFKKIWSLHLDETPVGAPLVVGSTLFMAGQERGSPPRASALHRFDLLGQSQGAPQQFTETLISGLAQVSHRLLLLSTYSADPMQPEGALLALDAAGQELWRWQPDVQGVSAPAVLDKRVWVTTNTGHLAALELETGQEQARFSIGLTPSPAAPALAGETAFIPTRGPHLPAIGLDDGQPRWQFHSDIPRTWLDKSQVVLGELVIAPLNLGGAVVALRSADGRPAWQVPLGPPGKPLTPPAIDGERLYIGTRAGLHALQPDDGREVWHFPVERGLEAAPVIDEGVVYIACRNHYIYAVEAATGQELHRYQSRRRLEVPPLIFAGKEPGRTGIVIADRGGTITALARPLSAEALESAGRWQEAALAYAVHGQPARGAELLESHDFPLEAAALWETAGEPERAAKQYTLAEAWQKAADLWGQLDRPREQAEALVQLAGAAEAEPDEQAAIWDRAADLFHKINAQDREIECRREAARRRQQPWLRIEVQSPEGLIKEIWSGLKFVVRNEGTGPATNLIIQLVNKEQFAGQIAQTRQITTLAPAGCVEEWLDVYPQQAGNVPLRLRIAYAGQKQTQTQTIYLPVALRQAEQQPSRVFNIYTGGGAYIEGDVQTGGGDFAGRDQTET